MIEQGLRQRDASALVAVLRSDAEFAGLLAPGALAAKLSALARVLPGAPVAALVAEEPQLLLASRCTQHHAQRCGVLYRTCAACMQARKPWLMCALPSRSRVPSVTSWPALIPNSAPLPPSLAR
jgi:hypothetical protein